MNLPVFLMAGSSEPAFLYSVSTLHVGKKSDLFGEFLRFFCGIMILLKRPNWTYLFVQKVLTKHKEYQEFVKLQHASVTRRLCKAQFKQEYKPTWNQWEEAGGTARPQRERLEESQGR